jgi:hypothetical protein
MTSSALESGHIHPAGHEIPTLLPPPTYNFTIMTQYREEFTEKMNYFLTVEVLAALTGAMVGYFYDLIGRAFSARM